MTPQSFKIYDFFFEKNFQNLFMYNETFLFLFFQKVAHLMGYLIEKEKKLISQVNKSYGHLTGKMLYFYAYFFRKMALAQNAIEIQRFEIGSHL